MKFTRALLWFQFTHDGDTAYKNSCNLFFVSGGKPRA